MKESLSLSLIIYPLRHCQMLINPAEFGPEVETVNIANDMNSDMI